MSLAAGLANLETDRNPAGFLVLMDITPHLRRLNYACLFYGTVVVTLAVAGAIDLTAPGIVAGGGVAAAGSTYYHVAKRLI